ncbi:MAG TPA: DUF445 domain-containing protein [Acetobacteraceae bacterium]|nr:DUF445 domain-containing protein [Acetobacteraceae bacterium]
MAVSRRTLMVMDGAARARSFIIAKPGKPMVKVVAVEAPAIKQRVGFLEGAFEVPDDFEHMGQVAIVDVFEGGPSGLLEDIYRISQRCHRDSRGGPPRRCEGERMWPPPWPCRHPSPNLWPMTDDPDAAARRSLRNHRAVATGLLLLMAALTVGSYFLPRGYATDILQAAAKAGFVGGLADWFAVTALFRHPLGLPIPHTAIIPREKARLGQALGRFVSRHVVNRDEVTRMMGSFDVGAFARSLLSDPEIVSPMARSLANMLPRVLASVEDGRARRTLARLVPRLVGGPEAGRVVARALRGLVAGGRHQEMLSFILDRLREGMISREEQLRGFIEQKVREEGGRLVGWALGATIATRVLGAVNAELERSGPGSVALRDAFDEWVRHEIERMETDPAHAREIGQGLRRVIAHETVQAWAWDVWSRLRMAMETDSARPNGRTVVILEGAIRNLGDVLATDEIARARLQRTVERMVATLMPAAQTQIADFIANVVASWDTATITERLELRVGADLQYVRMNGTLVGFAAGGALYAILEAIFGRVAF